MDVELRIQTLANGATTLLANGWVYVLQGSAVTIGRTDASGKVLALKANGNVTHPWEYTAKFVLAVGAQVGVYHSRGKTPIPSSFLAQRTNAFEQLTVPPASAQAAQVSSSGTNTIAIAPVSVLTLPGHVLLFSTPAELELLPISMTPFTPAYSTDSLPQGVAAFPVAGLAVTEDGAAAAPQASVRPRERAPLVTGEVAAAATAVRVQVLNAQGTPLQLLVNGASTTPVQEVTASLGAPGAQNRSFEVHLLFADPPRSFGPVQVLAFADGLAKPQFETAFFLMAGIELALVDDAETNVSGAQPGPIRGEANDQIVVDFLVSPQRANLSVITPAEQAALTAAQAGKTAAQQNALAVAARRVADTRAKNLNRADLSAQTRVRRMIRHFIRSRSRPLSAAQPVQVQHPEMPLWMGEVHLAGVTQASFEELLQRRRHSAPAALPPSGAGTPPAVPLFRMSFTWSMAMQWDAPNSAATVRPFRYQETFTAAVALNLDLDASDRLQSVTNGVATTAFVPAPAALTFPVNTRRAPQVRFGDQRPWGRVAGATAVPTTTIEFQPAIVAAGVEVMRGGDADLSVTQVTLDGAPINLGRDPQGANFVAPASTELRLPTLRVCGTTPANADVLSLIDALVAEFFNANATVARVTLLPLARWQTTVRRIVTHESGTPALQQFETRGAGRRTFGLPAFGHEQHMPLFGAPAGFGLGQLDNPPINNDQMWSYLEGLRQSIRLVMNDKARPAFNLVQPHIGAVPAATIAAVYQRAIVRAYNGNTEFRFRNGQFEIFPTGTDPARLPYPNHVLGTSVVYAGFSNPVPFTPADFGP